MGLVGDVLLSALHKVWRSFWSFLQRDTTEESSGAWGHALNRFFQKTRSVVMILLRKKRLKDVTQFCIIKLETTEVVTNMV